MDLIELYIQEVVNRLPEKNRDDIALELESTIFDMLPENYTEADVNEALTKLGNPALIASGYSEKPMYLIGPKYYDVYLSLLKLILPIALTVTLISVIAVKVFEAGEISSLIQLIIILTSEIIWNTVNVFVQTFFWLTITFIIIERADVSPDDSPRSLRFKRWEPADLKHFKIMPKQKLIKKSEVYASLIWTAVWASVYFNANKLLGVYEKGENGLVLVAPVFEQNILVSFWPFIVVIIVAEVLLAIFKMIKRCWTKELAIVAIIYEVLSALIFIMIITKEGILTTSFIDKMNIIFNENSFIREGNLIGGTIIVIIIYSAIAIFDIIKKTKAKSIIK